jgi:hypothetical protein
MKYRDNMTAEESKQLLIEVTALDELYASAHKESPDGCEDGCEDEMGELNKAALNRGRP